MASSILEPLHNLVFPVTVKSRLLPEDDRSVEWVVPPALGAGAKTTFGGGRGASDRRFRSCFSKTQVAEFGVVFKITHIIL
jgi:hypothetical protein